MQRKCTLLVATILMVLGSLPVFADTARMSWVNSKPTPSKPYLEIKLYYFEPVSEDSYWHDNTYLLLDRPDGRYGMSIDSSKDWVVANLANLHLDVKDRESVAKKYYNEKMNGGPVYSNWHSDKQYAYISSTSFDSKNNEYYVNIRILNIGEFDCASVKKVSVIGTWCNNGSKSFKQLDLTVPSQSATDFFGSGMVDGGSLDFSASHTVRYNNSSLANYSGAYWKIGPKDNLKSLSAGKTSTEQNVKWTVSKNSDKQSADIYASLNGLSYSISSSWDPNGNSRTLSLKSSARYLHTRSCTLPYPSNLKASFSMWERTVKLTWNCNQNGSSQSGKWVVYKTLNGTRTYIGYTSSGDYTVPANQLEWDKTYTFTVAFVPDAWYSDSDKKNAPPSPELNTSVNLTTSASYNITFTATPQPTNVLLKWSYNSTPTKDAGSQTPTFNLERYNTSTNKWDVLKTEAVTDPSQTQSDYTDGPLNSCLVYRYRVRFTAMGKTFYSDEKEAGISGATVISEFTASKGTYAKVVKLSWRATQMGTSDTKYTLKRRIIGKKDWNTIYTVSGKSNAYSYDDENIAPGTFYEYNVSCYVPCDDQDKKSNDLTDCGFGISTGVITGRVTYGTGQAVDSVRVRLIKGTDTSTSTNQQFYSAHFDGLAYNNGKGSGIEIGIANSAERGTLDASIFEKPFTMGMWIKPTYEYDYSYYWDKKLSLFSIGDPANGSFLEAYMENEWMHLRTYDKDNREIGIVPYLSFNNWQYVVLTYNGRGSQYTLEVFREGKLVGDCVQLSPDYNMKGDFPNKFIVGNSMSGLTPFTGYIDEVRIWDRYLTREEILNTYDRIIPGTTPGLKLYWPLDEGIDYVFDISKTDDVANENHGTMLKGTTSSVDYPDDDIFSLYGMTDKDGNYTVSGIPFAGEGINYMVEPVLGIHEFSPNRLTRMVSANSLVHSGVDFTDISSFEVTGSIYYKGTDIPVEGCNFYVDGQVCSANGKMVSSNADGSYKISVPIGKHYIEVRKNGHVFEGGGRYPRDPDGVGTDTTFIKPWSSLDFFDATLVNFAGRIVGGDIEGSKTLGFGLSQNNIGKVQMVLTPIDESKHLNMKETAIGTRYSYSINTEEVAVQSATDAIASNSYRGKGRDFAGMIFIETDPETGEFSALVPPLQYNVRDIKVIKTDTIAYDDTVIDLSNPLEETSDTLKVNGKDSVFTYNKSLMGTYHSQPVFTVTDETNDVGAYGIKDYTLTDLDGSLTVKDIYYVEGGNLKYKYDNPLFVMGDPYTFKMKGYEEYVNYDDESNPVTSTVPLSGSVVTINNALSATQKVCSEDFTEDGVEYKKGDIYELEENQLALDENGEGTYTWKAGMPNITYPYTRNMNVTFDINSRDYQWEGNPMTGIVLGNMPTGNNFVTSGPDAVHMILRDPPGSQSHTEWTEGEVTTNYHLEGGQYTTENSISTSTMFGAEIKEITGTTVFGIVTEENLVDELEIGAKIVGEGENSKSNSVTVTATRTVSTSEDPEYVGSIGDVFIGTATNVIFGKAREVGLTRTAAGSDEAEITEREVVTTGMKFGTAFSYTQYHIENVLLPNFEVMKESLLQTVKPEVLQSYINGDSVNNSGHMLFLTTLEKDNPKWGTMNDDKTIWGKDATPEISMNGPSYHSFRPMNTELADSCYQDSVFWINEQIESWQYWLAENEREKVEAFEDRENRLIRNVSFDSGSPVSYFEETDSTHVSEKEWSAGAIATVGNNWGMSINGTGVKFNVHTETGGMEHHDTYKETHKTASFEYFFQDDDAGDALTVDVLSSEGGYGPIFHTRGGQTCNPYEGQVVAQYYEPDANHEISAATMQIEMPQIEVDNAFITDIPSGQSATFTLHLTNASETNDDVIYKLMLDEDTNPYGAKLLIDGMPLTDGRMIKVPAGEVVTKSLQLSQSNLSVLEYNNIGIILASVGQSDPTGLWDVIADTAKISAQFVPSSSFVELETSTSVMNMFTGTNLMLTFKNFDRNYYNLKAFRIQYKQAGDADWTQIQEWVLDSLNLTTSNQMLPKSGSSISYTLPMEQFADGNYLFRVESASTYGLDEVKRWSDEIALAKDVARPALLGMANPSNGILSAGDDISVRFNEDIRNGALNKITNFSVTGALNDAAVAHDVALALNGSTIASTDVDLDLSSHDFSASLWLNRLSSGTIFTHGGGTNTLKVAANDEGKLAVTISDKTFVSEDTIPVNEWAFLALNYEQGTGAGNLSAIVAYDKYIKPLFTDVTVPENKSNGRLQIGEGMNGAMNELSIWNISQPVEDILATRNRSKAASSKGLIGYWKLNEGHGTEATDAARSRNLQLADESWYINNMNKAAHFDGETRLGVDFSQTSMLEDESYAVEFWVKPDAIANSTLVQSGDYKLTIGMNDAGRLTLTTPSETLTSTTALKADTWQHVALNVLRGQSAILYIDGKNALTMTEQSLPALQGDSLIIGATRNNDQFESLGGYHYSDNFKGDIDELRIWNASLQGKFLNDNRYNRIDTASVKGLVAYYPFESSWLDENHQVITGFSLRNVMLENPVTQTDCLPTEALTAPGLKTAPETTNLQFTFTASEREVFINLTDAPARLEGTTVYFTLNNVLDLHQNICVPIIWSAYIRRNPLQWDSENVNVVVPENETETFTVSFTNNGGTPQEWSLAGIPSWLTPSETQGTLDPLKTQTVTFTAESSNAIGNYHETIYLVGNDAINEPLEVSLKVTGDMPDWAVDPSKFDFNMNLTSQLFIKDVLCENADTRVAAFVGTECVGLAQPEYVPTRDTYYVCMTIYGDSVIAGSPIKFKVWDASTGIIYTSVETSQNIELYDGNICGTFSKPVKLSTSNIIEQQIALAKGWNWTSLYVQPQSTALNDVMDGYERYITTVKERYSFAASNDTIYDGSLATIEGAKLYMMYVVEPTLFLVGGESVSYDDGAQTVSKNWNWLGNPSQKSMTLDRAFAELNPQADDLVKSRSSFAIYNGYTWEGNLKSIEPGKGYLYHSVAEATKTFHYPESGSVGIKERPALYAATEESNFVVDDMSDYPGNMTIVAEVYLGEDRIDTLEVAVYAGEECRTATKANNGRYYITIPGDGEGPSLDFYTIFNDEVLHLNPGITYSNDEMLGTLATPFKLSFDDVIGINGIRMDADSSSIYTITGIKVGDDKTDLPKGIYIQNGKKLLVK